VTTFVIPRKPKPAPLPAPEDGHESLLRIAPELHALTSSEILPINLDIPRACAIAIGALPGIRSLRPLVVRDLPNHPLAVMDALEDYAMATYYAHLMAAPRSRSNERLQRVYQEVRKLRREMLDQAELLADRGHFDPNKVAQIRGGVGYQDVADDVISLSLLFRLNWPVVCDKTIIEQIDCERADVLGRELLTIRGTRLQPVAQGMTMDQALDRRSRCYTLFIRAYDCCRQAASFLRWKEGDADRVTPPLSPRPKKRRPKATDPSATADTNGASVSVSEDSPTT